MQQHTVSHPQSSAGGDVRNPSARDVLFGFLATAAVVLLMVLAYALLD